MKINLAVRTDLMRGVDRVEHADGEYVCHRMPAALAAAYENAESRQVRMHCTSGVRIVLATNSRWVRLSVRYGKAARPLYLLDVATGREPRPAAGSGDGAPWSGMVFDQAERRHQELTIWLTHCSQTRIVDLEVEDGAEVNAAPARDRSWLALGDSITQGMTCTTPSQTYVAQAAARLGADFRNLGVGGETMRGYLGRDTVGIAAEVISVALGVNDFNSAVGLTAYAAETRAVLAGLTANHPGVPVLAITPLPWVGNTGPNRSGETLEQYRECLRTVSATVPGVTVVEGPSLVADDPAMFVDGIHPNDAGMRAIADSLVPHLQQALGSAAKSTET